MPQESKTGKQHRAWPSLGIPSCSHQDAQILQVGGSSNPGRAWGLPPFSQSSSWGPFLQHGNEGKWKGSRMGFSGILCWRTTFPEEVTSKGFSGQGRVIRSSENVGEFCNLASPPAREAFTPLTTTKCHTQQGSWPMEATSPCPTELPEHSHSQYCHITHCLGVVE